MSILSILFLDSPAARSTSSRFGKQYINQPMFTLRICCLTVKNQNSKQCVSALRMLKLTRPLNFCSPRAGIAITGTGGFGLGLTEVRCWPCIIYNSQHCVYTSHNYFTATLCKVGLGLFAKNNLKR